jgi:hypothetical protein
MKEPVASAADRRKIRSWKAARLLARNHGFTAVRVLLGLILLTAAMLKLFGWNVTAVPRLGWFATSSVQASAIAWELILGLWLVTGTSQAWAWLAAIITFAVFAGVSAYYGWVGVASCGCFGAIRASPWTAFGVDVVALSLLTICRPNQRDIGAFRLPIAVSTIGIGTATALLILTGVGMWACGSAPVALARLRGESLTFSPDQVDFGTVPAGQVVERSVEVRNWTDRPIRVIGGTSDCLYVTTVDLPLTISPGETRSLTIVMQSAPPKLGALMRYVELWTDYDEKRTIRLQVACRVVE